MRSSFKKMNWIFSNLRSLNVKELVEVSLSTSGNSVKPIFRSADCKSRHIIIELGETCVIVVCSDSSKKTTTHKDLTLEFSWVTLNVVLCKDGSKRVCSKVKLCTCAPPMCLHLADSCINGSSKFNRTWSVINIEMWNTNPNFVTFSSSLSLEFLSKFDIRLRFAQSTIYPDYSHLVITFRGLCWRIQHGNSIPHS